MRHGGRVLDAPRDAPSAWATEATADRRHLTEGHPETPAAPVGEREDRGPDGRGVGGLPLDGRRTRGVYRDDREVAVEVGAGDLPGGGAPVGEDDRHLVAPHIVGVRQDVALGDDNPGSVPPAAADADNRWAGLGCNGPNCLLQFLQYAHLLPPR